MFQLKFEDKKSHFSEFKFGIGSAGKLKSAALEKIISKSSAFSP